MTDESTLTDEAPTVLYPVAFVIEPTRLGRHKEVGSFEVIVQESPYPLAEGLARAILAEIKPYLLTEDPEVWVDMNRHTFKINYGRFGGGTFRPADPDEEV